MATPLFLFTRQYDRTKLSSATNQAGLRISSVAAEANSGFMSLAAAGAPSAAVNHRVSLVAGGDIGTATFKLSTDGGTNYKGHATGWSDAEGGAAGTRKTIFSTTGGLTLIPTRPVLVDSDGDGVNDRVVIGINDGGGTYLDLYYTTALSRDGSSVMGTWTSLAADTLKSNGYRSALVNKNGTLYHFANNSNFLWVDKSTDGGATWTTGISSGSIAVDTNGVDATLLASGKILVTYTDTDVIYCRTTDDGVTFSAAKIVDATAATQNAPSAVQLQNGTTIVYFYRSGTGIVAKSNPAADPSTGTWSSHTVWTTGATETYPSACVGSDGRIYVVLADTTSEKIRYSYSDDDGTSYAAVADVSGGTSANTSDKPTVANIGGCIWCAFRRVDDDDIVVTFSRDWTTYSANAATTGTGTFIAPGPVWYTFGGSDGAASDYWDIDTSYDYAATNMFQLSPSRPTRATGDAADWAVVMDSTTSGVFAFNAICIWANVEHAHFQINATDSWGSPSKDYTLDLTEYGPAAFTSVLGTLLYKDGGTWAEGEHIGKILKFDTSGNCYTIRKNISNGIFASASVASETGNFRIINPKYVYTNITGSDATGYRFNRLLIENQQTVENYYEVKALTAARAVSFGRLCGVKRSIGQAHDSFTMPSGKIIRNARGESRAEFIVTIHRMSVAEFKFLRSMLEENDWGAVPFGFVPDSANAREWFPVYVDGVIEFNADTTTLRLVEAL